MAIFGNDVFSATTQLDAFNQIWNTLVGNLLTKQMAVTSSNTAFDNLTQTIKNSGAGSDAAKQSFQQYIAQIGSSAQHAGKAGRVGRHGKQLPAGPDRPHQDPRAAERQREGDLRA